MTGNNEKHSGSGENGLVELGEEINRAKEGILELIHTCPENLQAHRVYCSYVGKILDLHKTRAQTRVLEPERILVDTLKCVVLTLIEKSETDAAEVVGRFLEDIEVKVRERWQVIPETESTRISAESAPSSKPPSPPSESARPRKKGSARKKPSSA